MGRSEKMIIKKVYFFVLLMILLFNTIGCSERSRLIQIEIPTFTSSEEYKQWGIENNIQIKLITDKDEEINQNDNYLILDPPSGNINKGEVLEIKVFEKIDGDRTQYEIIQIK